MLLFSYFSLTTICIHFTNRTKKNEERNAIGMYEGTEQSEIVNGSTENNYLIKTLNKKFQLFYVFTSFVSFSNSPQMV